MKLYGYWRSSATYRVRIALALKGLDYDYEALDLLAGAQKSAAYLKTNPLGLVPSLKVGDGPALTQSLAIMEYLEETHPAPSILPGDAAARAASRAIAAMIACEAQPFMNIGIQSYLKTEHGFDDGAISKWLNNSPRKTMAAVEAMVGETGGDFCVGDAPSMADCCLVPQMFAAERFGVDISDFKRLHEINKRCLALPAFEKAHPKNQPDAPA